MSIGEMIYNRRKALNMTQKDLAQKLNISDRTVSRWECGNSLPDVVMLKTVAKVLEMDIADFYSDVPESEINKTETVDYERIEQYKRGLILPFLLLVAALVSVFMIKVNYSDIFSMARIQVWDPEYNAYLNELYQKMLIACMMTLCAFICSITWHICGYVSFRQFYRTKKCKKIYIALSRRVNIVYIIFAILYIIIFSAEPQAIWCILNDAPYNWKNFIWKLL